MTTNKPEVFEVYRTRQGTLENVVLLADYEALQAECERWKRGSEIRDEQNQDLHSFVMELKAECEKLRKNADRYRWIKECEPEEIDIVVENPGDDLDAIIDAAMEPPK